MRELLQQVDQILNYLAQNPEAFLRPDGIITAAKLEIEETIAALICDKLSKEGYLFENGGFYSVLFKGIEFCASGGFVGELDASLQASIQTERDRIFSQTMQSRLNCYTLFLGIATVLLVAVEVVKWIYELNHPH